MISLNIVLIRDFGTKLIRGFEIFANKLARHTRIINKIKIEGSLIIT